MNQAALGQLVWPRRWRFGGRLSESKEHNTDMITPGTRSEETQYAAGVRGQWIGGNSENEREREREREDERESYVGKEREAIGHVNSQLAQVPDDGPLEVPTQENTRVNVTSYLLCFCDKKNAAFVGLRML